MSTVDARDLVGKAPIKKIRLGDDPKKHPDRWEAFRLVGEAWRKGRIGDVADYFWEARSHSAKDQTSRLRDRAAPVFDGETFYWMEYEGNSAVGAWTVAIRALNPESALKKIKDRIEAMNKPLTKREKRERLKALDAGKAKEILTQIVMGCIEGGRESDMRSTDILDSICDTLEENGLGR